MPNPEPQQDVHSPDEAPVDYAFVAAAERLLLEPDVVRWLGAERPSYDDEPPQAA
jgi:hypothetical protein